MYKEARDQLRLDIENKLKELGFLVKRRNRSLDLTPQTKWGRVTFLDNEAKSAELGQLTIRDTGTVVIDIFVPLNTGTEESDRVSILIRDTFSEYQYNYLELQVGSINDVPTTLDYFHVAVRIPFRHK